MGPDSIRHLLERRPYLAVGEIDEIAQADGQADLEVAIRILERLPYRIREREFSFLKEQPIGETVG